MTKLAVAIMVRSLDQALAAAARAAEHGADLVEFRIDDVADQPDMVLTLLARSALPCILTCRPTWEGGHYDGDDQTRISLFEKLGTGTQPPAYLDVELAAWQRSANLRQKVALVIDRPGQLRPVSTGMILSSHDFEQRPRDLYQRLEAMSEAPACRVIKLVWTARSLRDNLEAFELLASRPKPMIALCMGEMGLPSRVLARKFGALLTFVALDEGSGTAPGQPTLSQIKSLYRWDHIGPQTKVYGVIGHPVAHSMSPAIHNAGFTAVGFDGVYLPMPIAPGYEPFEATVGSWLDAAGLDFCGASVTIPHKENLLRFVRQRGGEIEPLAERIGAANTLTRRPDGTLYASNTDYDAALDAVCEGLGIERNGLRGRRVAVIGAGGAARAIVAGFAACGATVVCYNRTLERAQELAEAFNGVASADGTAGGKVVAARLEKLCDSCCEVLINCTPVGMHPHTDATPLPQLAQTTPGKSGKRQFGPGTVVFDTIYNPLETRLLREAKAAGCVTISGAEMFVRQAMGQFTLWTGRPAPRDVFERVVTERLSCSADRQSPKARGR